MPSIIEDTKSFNDWPNHQGFDTTYEERTPVELKVTGSIPSWAAGTLYRSGIGPRKFDTVTGKYHVNHWFDGLAVVHRFQITATNEENPTVRVIYNSRSTCDGLIERIRQTGERKTMTFARKYDPCTSYFQKVMSIFREQPERLPNEHSMSITLSADFPGLPTPSSLAQKDTKGGHASGIRTLINKTDSTVLQTLDPETLEPLGIATQRVLHPDLKGPMSAAHAKSDPVTGDVYNFNLEFGRIPTYRVFCVSASTGKTSILATITGADPAYIHSIFMTENYVILCVWNSFFVARGLKILWTRNILDAIGEYDNARPAQWYVIDRRTPENGGKGLIATYESDPFFAFHSVNAYEVMSEDGQGTDIVADVVAYNNLNCLKCFYLNNLVSTSPEAGQATSEIPYKSCLKRFRLPSIPASPTNIETSRASSNASAPGMLSVERFRAILEFETDAIQSPELPIINPQYVTRPHRYVYGLNATGKSSFFDGIVKIDTKTKEAKYWSHRGQNAGEPIFVPRKLETRQSQNGVNGVLDEDDGVLLSVVLDGFSGKSYLLVLDAKTLDEVGRAHVAGPIGFGFHGIHVPAANHKRALDL
ncbi:hypothetical protein FQN57_000175 [Myotisia sp. PD_48]|nr:hypothetical protein FQN57_000175 [Myotisia sp. PD_48]